MVKISDFQNLVGQLVVEMGTFIIKIAQVALIWLWIRMIQSVNGQRFELLSLARWGPLEAPQTPHQLNGKSGAGEQTMT